MQSPHKHSKNHSTSPGVAGDAKAQRLADDEYYNALIRDVDDWLSRIGPQIVALENRHRKNLSIEDDLTLQWKTQQESRPSQMRF